MPADNVEAPPVLIARRRPNIQYSVDASHGKLWIVTNDDHINFRLAEADPAHPGDWRTVIRRLGPGLYARRRPPSAIISPSPSG